MNIGTIFSKFTKGQKLITARLLVSYVKDPFITWAELFAPKNKRDPETAFQNLLFEKGTQHETEVIEKLFPDSTEIKFTNDTEGFRFVLEEMVKGTDKIHNAPLMLLPEGLYGRADVIEKVSGKSVFGNYQYVVKEIKLAKNLREEHIIQSALYNYILGKIQGHISEKFYLINHDNETSEYDFNEYKKLLKQSIKGTMKIINKQDKPTAVFGTDWPWENYSKELALENNDVTLIFKLGQSMKAKLNKKKIFNIDDLKNAKPFKILRIKGVGEPSYKKWMIQIDSLKNNKVIALGKPEFKKVKTEIYFDIEGDQDLGIDYLYGCLINNVFRSFWSDTLEGEEKLWKDFCEYIKSLMEGEFVIYHYAPYEKTSINRMCKQYGCDEKLLEKMKDHMVDLFQILTKNFVMPIYSYSLKPVAKSLGFKWRADDASGSNSIEWYARYLKGQKDLKQKILDYNEDDVKATKMLKEWMEKS